MNQTSIGSAYESSGSRYTDNFKGLYHVTSRNSLRGSLHAFVDNWEWKKCGTGSCSDTVSKTQTQTMNNANNLKSIDPTTVKAFLRTSQVYVDKPNFHIVFSVTDSSGSPYFITSGSNTASLSSSNNTLVTGMTCQTGTNLGNYYNRWLYYCSGNGNTFLSSSNMSIRFTITLSDGITSHQVDVGGNDVHLNELTLSQTPSWWHPDLRSNIDVATTWPGPKIPASNTFFTLPTYPLYANEEFEVTIYNYKDYVNFTVYSSTMTVYFDSTKVSYVEGEETQNHSCFFGGLGGRSPPSILHFYITAPKKVFF